MKISVVMFIVVYIEGYLVKLGRFFTKCAFFVEDALHRFERTPGTHPQHLGNTLIVSTRSHRTPVTSDAPRSLRTHPWRHTASEVYETPHIYSHHIDRTPVALDASTTPLASPKRLEYALIVLTAPHCLGRTRCMTAPTTTLLRFDLMVLLYICGIRSPD